MNRIEHRYVLELFRESGEALEQVAVTPDWEPLKEWLRLELLRSGTGGDPVASDLIRIEPVWSRTEGPPYVGLLRASVGGTSAAGASCEVTSARYLRRQAQAAADGLVERGRLSRGDRYRYLVAAFPAEAGPPGSPALGEWEEASPNPPLRETAIGDFAARASRAGPAGKPPFDVFIPRSVIREAEERVGAAGGLETGGILVGHLHRDAVQGELFVEVTAQIPATQAESGTHRLGFTPATWQDVRAALDLRGRSELMLGWYHSHGGSKYWCSAACSAEERKRCPLNQSFFSTDDVVLHRTVFFKAYAIALVFTHTEAGIECAGYGWHEGLIEARGFAVLDASAAPPVATAVTASIGGIEHGTHCTT